MLLHRGDFLLEARSFRLSDIAFLQIGGVEGAEVATDALLDLFDAALQLALGEIALARIHAFELAAVDGSDCMSEETLLTADQNEPSASSTDAWTIVAPKICDRFEVGRQTASQPHQLDIAQRLALKPSARLDAVQIPIKIDLEQCRRMIAWPACVRGLRTVEISKVQMFNVRIDHPRRIVVRDVIIKAPGKKRLLRAIFALDEPAHLALRHHAERLNLFAFPHSHSPKRTPAR